MSQTPALCSQAALENLVFLQKMVQGCNELKRAAEMRYLSHPRELVFQYHKAKLYHYQAKIKKPQRTPLLVVFATVNRPEVLDLFPERSFIGGLLENGTDVYLLDWGYPDSEDNHISMSDYVVSWLRHCIQFIIESSKQSRIHLLGICQGGLLCLCYALLFNEIKKLVLISAPIDFHTKDNIIAKMFARLDIDSLLALSPNVSGNWLTQFFISLRPFELIGKKYLRFIDQLEDKKLTEKFLRVEKWLYDAPDQTGTSFRDLIVNCYQQNQLIHNQLWMNNQRIQLNALRVPVLNIIASEDEIIPPSASSALKKYVAKKFYTEKIYASGHIGIYISEKVGKRLPMEIASWLKSVDDLTD